MTTLAVKTFFLNVYQSGSPFVIVYYQAPDYVSQPTSSPIGVAIGATQDLTTTPYPTFVSGTAACLYYKDDVTVGAPALMDQINTQIGSSVYTDYTIEFMDTPVNAAFMALATVASSGLYSDLLSKPALFSGAYADLSGKPTLFSGSYTDLTSKPTLFSGNYTDLSGKPTLFSGSYSDLTGKPSLATVATTGAYTDITSRPILAAVATSGAYADLSGKPSIPAAQVQSDWSASSGLGVILNKPTIPSVTRSTSSLTLSLVGTGATGTQISATKDSTVHCTVSTQATATISGAATSTVTAKICATNSATEANWTTVAVSETSQNYSLAVALQGVTGGKGELSFEVPAAWFCKLENTGSGTHSESFLFGQQTIYG